MKLTHKALQEAVVKHYNKNDSYVALPELREGTGYGANHEADVIAFGVWPSRGMEIIGHEIKANRSDWLHELKDGSKAESIARFCHSWILITGVGVAKLEEIPSRWGWWEHDGKGFVVNKVAEKAEPREMERTFVASIMRNIKKNYVPASVLERAIADMDKKMEGRLTEEYGKRLDDMTRKLAYAEDQKKITEDILKRFESAAGVYLARTGNYGFQAESVGKCVRLIKDRGLLNRFTELMDNKADLEKRLREIQAFVDLLDDTKSFDFIKKEEKETDA